MSKFSLLNNENLYFKFSCLHIKLIGEIFITNNRIYWQSNDNIFQSTWTNVIKVKYSPNNDPKGRCAINLDLLVKSVTNSTYFELIDSNKDKCRQSLDKLKEIISYIKRNEFNQLIIIPYNNNTSNNNESKPMIGINNNIREQILSSDKFINQQYQDLVITSKLLNEDEFWNLYKPASLIDNNNNKSTLTKGKLPNIYVENLRINENEWLNVSETKKSNIFNVYPSIKLAYDNKDSLNISEEDFWRRYYYSFHHTSTHIDDLFLRFIDKSTTSIIPYAIDSKVDLTNITDDYYKQNIDISNDFIADSKNNTIEETKRLLTGGWNEFNKQSNILIDNELHISKRLKSNSDDLNELTNQSNDKYIPLVINKNTTNHTTATPTIDTTNSFIDGDAFSKSNNYLTNTNIYTDPNDILLTITSILPNHEKSIKFLTIDIDKSHSLSELAKRAASGGGSYENNSTIISNEYIDLSNNCTIDEGEELPDTFRQDMGEIYVSITERLRHFYSIISREGSQAPTFGSSAEAKAQSIIDDLDRITDKLNDKKTNISNDYTGKTMYACIWLIQDIKKLIERSKFIWKSYQQNR